MTYIPAFPKPSQKKKTRKWRDENGVIHLPDSREICDLNCAAGRRSYAERKEKMLERQGRKCCLGLSGCTGMVRLSKYDMQFEHEDGKGFNGGHRDDRILVPVEQPGGTIKLKWQNGVSCPWCNSRKGSKRIAYNQ
jgi:hypothetical protein